jgi:anti-repressor protein
MTETLPAPAPLTPFPCSFEGQAVRVLLDERGEPWFAAVDVGEILQHSNIRVAVATLDADEKRSVSLPYGPHGDRDTTLVSEAGLYTLILRARVEGAKRFRRWVTHEVLPAIRRTGSYAKPSDTDAILADPAALRTLLLGYTEKVLALEAKLEDAAPKAAFVDAFVNADGLFGLQQAARALGMPPRRFVDELKRSFLFYQGSHLVPYRQYIERGLFVVRVFTITREDGSEKACPRTYVTPKGLEHFGRTIALAKTSGAA